MKRPCSIDVHHLERSTKRAVLIFAAICICVVFTNSRIRCPSVNLIVAVTHIQDYSWTSKVEIPGLRVIPFLADDPTATFHPPQNKGREAMIYLTYLYEFYDSLPDISIFTHADDKSWHVDSIFDSSTAYALNHLDLNTVLQRQYLNLRVDWRHACPAWINTSSTSTENGTKFEQPFVAAAFEANFPTLSLPEILAQPCCSQFAVTKSAIRSVPREQYRASMKWLLESELSDQLTGRIWEHFWHFLFLREAVYCPMEYDALCVGWRICFETQEEMDGWKALAKEREDLHPTLGRKDPPRGRIESLDENLRRWRQKALARGRLKMSREKNARMRDFRIQSSE